MDAEEKRIREQNKALPWKARMQNYWHYYKVHFFVVLIVAVLVATTVVQCVTAIKYDLMVAVYSEGMFSEEQTAQIADMLKVHCKDIHGDDEVNVNVSANSAKLGSEVMDEMSQGVFVKLQAELAAGTCAAFIVDEAFKDLFVKSFEYPVEDVTELTAVPGLRESLKLPEEERLYFLPSYEHKKNDKPDQFDNAKLVKEYIKSKKGI